jgi:hypothetical protein
MADSAHPVQSESAYWGPAHDRLNADIAIRARPVLDDEWLAESLREP